MNLLFNLFDLIDILYFTQGTIFGLIFIFTGRRERPTLFLGLFLLCFVINGLPVFLEFIVDEPAIDFNSLPGVLFFLTLPLFYAYAHKVSVIKKQGLDYRILILGAIELVVFTALTLRQIPYHNTTLYTVYSILGMIFSIYIAIKIIQFSSKHLRIVKNQYASISGLKLLWVKQFIIVLLVNIFLNIFLSFFEENDWTELFLLLFDLCLVYWVIYKGLRQENVEPLIDEEKEGFIEHGPISQSKPKIIITEDHTELENIVNLLDTHLLNSKDYKLKELSIIDLSRSIKTSPKKVSRAINYNKNVNFNSYINAYRIEEAIRYLQDSSFNYLSIEGIASEVGFKSKSAFYYAFKKEKNYTPLELRNKTTQLNDSDS